MAVSISSSVKALLSLLMKAFLLGTKTFKPAEPKAAAMESKNFVSQGRLVEVAHNRDTIFIFFYFDFSSFPLH